MNGEKRGREDEEGCGGQWHPQPMVGPPSATLFLRKWTLGEALDSENTEVRVAPFPELPCVTGTL